MLNSAQQKDARRIVHDLIVVKGRSYQQAIRECEVQANYVAAPWRKVAADLRAELDRMDSSFKPDESERPGG